MGHELGDILTIALCSALCGMCEFTEMEDFGQFNESWLKKFLGLRNGIPSHDTFRRVFMLIDPRGFLEAFAAWTTGVGGGTVAIDGKALRGAAKGGREAVVMVNAWACSAGVSLGTVRVEGKSNEITALPVLLDALALEGCVVTTDAMGCQREVAAKIRGKGADYVLSLKGNQGNLHADTKAFLDGLIDGDEVWEPSYISEERGHGRHEKRTCWVAEEIEDDFGEWLRGSAKWEGLKTLVAVELERTVKGETGVERRYFISSLPEADGAHIAAVVREHWGVENSLHWVLDVNFGEDSARAREGYAAGNLSALRQLALGAIKSVETDKYEGRSLKRKMVAASNDEDYRLELLHAVIGA